MNSVRAYLLGTLREDEAAVIEARYFTDQAFFKEVRKEEQILIDDYLKDRLTAADKELFESRYLHVPELQRAVEEGRQRLAAANRSPKISMTWQLVLAGALIGGLGFGSWVYLHQQGNVAVSSTSSTVARTSPPDMLPVVSLNLTPGVKKGNGEKTAQLTLKSRSFPVRINAELPGQRSTVECLAAILLVGADGPPKKVWSSDQPVRSIAIATGQQVTLTLDSSVLQPGDYILQLSRSKGEVLESYVFRVNPRE